MSQLARDNGIGLSTGYAYRDEALTVLATRKPTLHGALLAAKAAGHTHVIVDGTLIDTDRNHTPGPTAGVDLWWSGKRHQHGGNVQVVFAPDGWPLWTFTDVRLGREHDTTAARADPDLLTQIQAWVEDGRYGLANLGYEGEADILRIPIKKTGGLALTVDQQAYNAVHGALRALGKTRQQPAQDYLQSAAPVARLPMANRHRRSRGAHPAPPRERPDDVTARRSPSVINTLLGKAVWCRRRFAGAESAGAGPLPAAIAVVFSP